MPKYQYETVFVPYRLRMRVQQAEIDDKISEYVDKGYRLVSLTSDSYWGRVILVFEKEI